MHRHELSATDSAEAVPGVHLAQLGTGDNLNAQHFELEPETEIPEHDHSDNEQLSFVYEGAVTFLVDGEAVTANAGDVCIFAPGETHAIENRGEVTARGIDVYGPPRPAPDWVED